MADKRTTLAEAAGRLVQDGDTLVCEGFTHLIPFAAGCARRLSHV